MRIHFRIFLIVFFISGDINAEIKGVNVNNLTQLYNNQISKILVGKKISGNYDDGIYRGSVEEIHYQNGDYEVTTNQETYKGKWKTLNNEICYLQTNWLDYKCVLVYVGFDDSIKLYFVEKIDKGSVYIAGIIYEEIY
jgi:hypothetical protein